MAGQTYFYFRAETASGKLGYSVKKYEDFEELQLALRKGRTVELPPLPKKIMFVQMADANALSLLLETYLRKVANCEALMAAPPARERVLGFLGLEDGRDIGFKVPVASLQGVKIGKTEATKAMVGSNFETLFGFRVALSSSRLIRKTRGDFLELHADTERWLANRRSSCQLDFPRDGPCEAQHQKLLSYLQELLSL